ncbi:MAG TPA: heme exporter protein CcmB [Fimbriimonadaceae bacterium]|nr:heme exporter protein CcmB [Fimbriimonadaceae bacterium]
MSWSPEVEAIFRKEIQSELRSKSGLLTSGLFGIVSVVAIAFATLSVKITPTMAAGLFWITLLFSSMISLPRAFTVEEELGTGDLLRLMARPHAVFWGKVLFNLVLLVVTALLLSTLFVLLTQIHIVDPILFALGLLGGVLSLAGGVTLSGALVAQAANRAALAAAVALPLLVPLTAVGVATLRVAFGDTGGTSGYLDALGLVCYGVISVAIGPYLYAVVWKS